MSSHDDVAALGQQAVAAQRDLLRMITRKKNAVLRGMADELEARRDAILAVNADDLSTAEQSGLPAGRQNRLRLTPARFTDMVKLVRSVADFTDPIGSRICRWIRPNGLEIIKQRVPIGVVAVIHDAQPALTVAAAAFCVKTANAAILCVGNDALPTSRAIVDAMVAGGAGRGLPDGAVNVVQSAAPQIVDELVTLNRCIDLIVAHGDETMIRAISEKTTIPILHHACGVCHTYIDESADLQMALDISENAKCQRPAACNAMETLLVHEKIAPVFLPAIASRMAEKGIALRGDDAARALVPAMAAAREDDWGREYLGNVLSVRVVPTLHVAVEHITAHGSRHSDAVVAQSGNVQKAFVREVDSAAVFVNSSTRFNDGASFGMGAEIGISTSKLHARGPMGLEELTTYKYVVHGKGQVRE